MAETWSLVHQTWVHPLNTLGPSISQTLTSDIMKQLLTLVALVAGCHIVVKEPKGKALNLPVDKRSSAHLWSKAVGSNHKNEIMNISGQNMGCLGFCPEIGWEARTSIEPSILCIEWSQVKWLRHLIRAPLSACLVRFPGHIPLKWGKTAPLFEFGLVVLLNNHGEQNALNQWLWTLG